MKPTFELNSRMVENNDRFNDPFFERFKLRPAAAPLQLSEQVSKNYLFPTFYANVSCSIGIFFCDYDRAQSILPDPKMKPVKMTHGRSLVVFSCYQYRNVLNVAPYNEIAMTIPILADPVVSVPVLPMILNVFPSFGFYVFGMPVTSKENQIRGNKIWGLPKVTQEIDIFEDERDSVCIAKEDNGQPYFELRVPKSGKPTTFDVSTNLYSRLGREILKSETCFSGTFNVTKHMKTLTQAGLAADREYLKIGDTASTQILRQLKIEKHPFQFRYTDSMNSAFDLPDANFKWGNT